MATNYHEFLAFAARYALRSLWRNKRRTLLTVGSVTLSVAVSIICNRYSTAVMKIWADGAIDHGAGHAQLHARGYATHPDTLSEETLLKEGQDVERRLADDPDVLAVSRRLLFEGIISAHGKTLYFLGRSVSPEAELRVCPAEFGGEPGSGQFVSSARPTGVTIGRGLADALGLQLGDEATLLASTLSGGANGLDVVVTGIVTPPLPALSKRLVYLHVDQGQKTIRAPGRYSELAVRLRPGVDPESWVERFRPVAESLGLDLAGWWQVDPIIRKVERIWNSVVGVISGLLFVSAGISVLNIVFLLVAERTVEIGTLLALGARSRDVRTLFALEASLIGAIGAVVGALLGNAYVVGMDLIGVPFDSPFNGGRLFIHPHPSLAVTLVVGAVAVVICYVAALAPARKAARLEPVVAFRGQNT